MGIARWSFCTDGREFGLSLISGLDWTGLWTGLEYVLIVLQGVFLNRQPGCCRPIILLGGCRAVWGEYERAAWPPGHRPQHAVMPSIQPRGHQATMMYVASQLATRSTVLHCRTDTAVHAYLGYATILIVSLASQPHIARKEMWVARETIRCGGCHF